MNLQSAIDAILAHGRAYPHLWERADARLSSGFPTEVVNEAKVRTLIEYYRREPAFGYCDYPLLFRTISLLGVHNPAAYACLALYTWPDSARFLGTRARDIALHAYRTPTDYAALLLLPAATAMSGTVPQSPDPDQTPQQTNQKT